MLLVRHLHEDAVKRETKKECLINLVATSSFNHVQLTTYVASVLYKLLPRVVRESHVLLLLQNNELKATFLENLLTIL